MGENRYFPTAGQWHRLVTHRATAVATAELKSSVLRDTGLPGSSPQGGVGTWAQEARRRVFAAAPLVQGKNQGWLRCSWVEGWIINCNLAASGILSIC